MSELRVEIADPDAHTVSTGFDLAREKFREELVLWMEHHRVGGAEVMPDVVRSDGRHTTITKRAKDTCAPSRQFEFRYTWELLR